MLALNLLAIVSVSAIVWVVFKLAIAALIFYVLWWGVDYFQPAEPFNKVIRGVLIIGAIFVCIDLLLSLIGQGFIGW